MREKWIGSGWKMHKTRAEAASYAEALRRFVTLEGTQLRLFLAVPHTALVEVSGILADVPVLVGAQNMHWADSGPITGEISPLMIKDCGAQLVELGHSERREAFGETDYLVNRKVLSALRHDLRPLICVGETLVEKEFGVADVTVSRQVRIALRGVAKSQIESVMIAYEPVWAIGDGGTPADPTYVDRLHRVIRGAVSDLCGERAALAMPILYGGSVNFDNAPHLIVQREVDGLFVGRLSWDVSSFIELVRLVEAAVGR